MELLLVLGPMAFWIKRCGKIVGLEHWRAAQKKGKGCIFLSSHVGNWEIMGAIGAAHGMDLMFVTKKLKPEWLHEAIERGRAKFGVRGTYEPKTSRDVLRHLRKGGTIGMILDQYSGPPVGVRVPVFGVPVGTSMALATFARRTNAPILPVVNYRTRDGKVVVEIRPENAFRRGRPITAEARRLRTARQPHGHGAGQPTSRHSFCH